MSSDETPAQTEQAGTRGRCRSVPGHGPSSPEAATELAIDAHLRRFASTDSPSSTHERMSAQLVQAAEAHKVHHSLSRFICDLLPVRPNCRRSAVAVTAARVAISSTARHVVKSTKQHTIQQQEEEHNLRRFSRSAPPTGLHAFGSTGSEVSLHSSTLETLRHMDGVRRTASWQAVQSLYKEGLQDEVCRSMSPMGSGGGYRRNKRNSSETGSATGKYRSVSGSVGSHASRSFAASEYCRTIPSREASRSRRSSKDGSTSSEEGSGSDSDGTDSDDSNASDACISHTSGKSRARTSCSENSAMSKPPLCPVAMEPITVVDTARATIYMGTTSSTRMGNTDASIEISHDNKVAADSDSGTNGDRSQMGAGNVGTSEPIEIEPVDEAAGSEQPAVSNSGSEVVRNDSGKGLAGHERCTSDFSEIERCSTSLDGIDIGRDTIAGFLASNTSSLKRK